jgi:integrase
MRRTSKSKVTGPIEPKAGLITLASVLAGLDQTEGVAATRLRDLRSATRRVAELLGDTPSAVVLDMPEIAAKLGRINPVAVGMTPKRLTNIRSDFLGAVRTSGVRSVEAKSKPLSPAWAEVFSQLSGRRTDIGLSRLGRYSSTRGIEPGDVTDDVIEAFITTVRDQSLHQRPNALHRQTTLIWNEAARDPKLGLRMVTVASFRGPPKRIAWNQLSEPFRQDVDTYLSWAGQSDPFATSARPRALSPGTLRLRRDQIHAAVSALVDSGIKPEAIASLADLFTPLNFKAILRRRFDLAAREDNAFNKDLGIILVLIAREWAKVDSAALAELKRLVGKLPASPMGLTRKNKGFLRQFDEPKALIRLIELPERIWAEVKRAPRPSFLTLAKAQAALAIAILTYIPVRLQNLSDLTFDTHLFVLPGADAISTLELSSSEVKNGIDLAFDIPPSLAKKLIEYRERIAPRIIGHRPTRLFVNADGTPKSAAMVATLISSYLKKRAGIVMTPHQFRHLSAKIVLDAQPGAFEVVRQLLGHKLQSTTVNAYAGIDSRRAARHHQRLIETAVAPRIPSRPRRHPAKSEAN